MFINHNQLINSILEKNHPSNKKIIQINPYTLNFVIWKSIIDINKMLNFNMGAISEVCNGKSNQAYGYYWKYYSDFIDSKYIQCDKNNYLDIFNLLPGGNLSNYISPCFTLLQGEILKDIPNYEKLYQISNYGRIISIKNHPYIKELKPGIDKDGYCLIVLHDGNGNKKTHKLHRLVAEIFIPNTNKLPCVNHKDEIKNNNFVNNLEWCTHNYNNNYGNRLNLISKSLNKQIEQYDLNTKKIIRNFKSIKEASEITGFSQSFISLICNKKYHPKIGFGWKFKEI